MLGTHSFRVPEANQGGGKIHTSCLTVSVLGLVKSCWWHLLSVERARPRAMLNSFSVLEQIHGEKLNAIYFPKMD